MEVIEISNLVTFGLTWILSGTVIIEVLCRNRQLKAIIYLCLLYMISTTASLGVTICLEYYDDKWAALACYEVMLSSFGVIYWTFAIKYWNLYRQLNMMLNP